MQYAQTNIQLFNQLRDGGYSQKDIALIRDAYELAMELFGGRFQASGKPFIAHVVGTASILAWLRVSAPVVAAGLLHNAYEHGDFGVVRRNATPGKRRKVRRLLGDEVEEYVASFAALHWQCPTVQFALDDPERLNLLHRHVLSIRLADYLDHLLDLDLLYYSPSVRRYCADQGTTAIWLAESFKLEWLAAELKEAIRDIESAELPVNIPPLTLRDE